MKRLFGVLMLLLLGLLLAACSDVESVTVMPNGDYAIKDRKTGAVTVVDKKVAEAYLRNQGGVSPASTGSAPISVQRVSGDGNGGAPTPAVPIPPPPAVPPTTAQALGECPSPEEASKMIVTQQSNGQVDGPALRAIGNPVWLGGNRDTDDVCVFSFDRNRMAGKDFMRYKALPGVVVTSNETDNKVRVWNGQSDLVVTSSAATLRFLDNPNTRLPIYGLRHRFRDACSLLSNERVFTDREAAEGGFTSIHDRGNISCSNNVSSPPFLGINQNIGGGPVSTGSASAVPQQIVAVVPNPATSSASTTTTTSSNQSTQQVIDLLVKDEARRANVTCREDQGAFVCEAKGGAVTITHPGKATIDYWSGSPAPSGAGACQVNVSGSTRSVSCDSAGATMKDEHWTYRPQ